jgi:hypothetical protein
VEEAEMARSGEEATSGRDELTLMDETLEHFTQGVIALDTEAREGEGVQGGLALAQGVDKVLTMTGGGGGISLGDGIIGVTEPEEGGMLLLGDLDQTGQGGRLGTQTVFGAVQE